MLNPNLDPFITQESFLDYKASFLLKELNS